MSNFAFLLEGTTTDSTSIWPTLIMIGLLIVFFYFFMIRPQKKKEKEDAQMRDALAVGDEVTTIGGIVGKIISIKGETFVLETTKDKTKIRFLKGAIRSVDVKAADIAAAILETKEVPAKEAEAETPAAVEAPEAVEASETAEAVSEENTENK